MDDVPVMAIGEAVKPLVALLVSRDYEGAIRMTKASRLQALDLALVVCDYGKTLRMPPNTAFYSLDVIPVERAQPPQWSVCMPLWTVEEGSSDLTLELTVSLDNMEYLIELDDLHVL